MSTILSDFESRVVTLLKDAAAKLASDDIVAAVLQAAALYSLDRPLTRVSDISGAGSFDLALPTGWVDGFSQVKQIEYPYDSSYPQPPTIDNDDWTIYQNPTGKVLRLLADTPTSGETVRLHFSAPHRIPSTDAVAIVAYVETPAVNTGAVRDENVVTITTDAAHGAVVGDLVRIAGVHGGTFDGTFPVASVPTAMTLTYAQTAADETSGGGTCTIEATVPDRDLEPVSHLAASLAFEQLAALSIGSTDPTVAADVVDYRSKSDQYRSAAKAQLAIYKQHLGKGADVGAASGVTDLRSDLSVGGDRLTHPRRTQ
jgi:hypothetical protein